LIRIDREDSHPEKLAHQAQDSRVYPRCLAVAKGVIKIEAALQSLANRESFEIGDRHTVLENQRGVISTQRQSIFGRDAGYKDLRTATKIGLEDVSRVPVGEPMQLAIANGRSLASEIQHCFGLRAREFFDRDGR